jgi:hypothetical protein
MRRRRLWSGAAETCKLGDVDPQTSGRRWDGVRIPAIFFQPPRPNYWLADLLCNFVRIAFGSVLRFAQRLGSSCPVGLVDAKELRNVEKVGQINNVLNPVTLDGTSHRDGIKTALRAYLVREDEFVEPDTPRRPRPTHPSSARYFTPQKCVFVAWNARCGWPLSSAKVIKS